MVDFKEVVLPLTYKTRNKLVCGIGINDAWYITERKVDGINTKCPYSVKWKSLMNSVANSMRKTDRPAEDFITLDWLTFSNFRRWMETQEFANHRLSVSTGCTYSPENCGFIEYESKGLFFGVGYNPKGKHPTKIDGIPTKEQTLWLNMLARCYGKHQKDGRNSTYADCSVSENFKDFQYFAEWCQSQVGFGLKDWHLDKDILFKGNKIYSEDTCVFVPSELNVLFNKKKKQRGDYPIGVSKSSKPDYSYSSVCNHNGKQVWLGYHTTVEAAFFRYKEFKESVVKGAANKWKDQIDPRAYTALMNYQVEITD